MLTTSCNDSGVADSTKASVFRIPSCLVRMTNSSSSPTSFEISNPRSVTISVVDDGTEAERQDDEDDPLSMVNVMTMKMLDNITYSKSNFKLSSLADVNGILELVSADFPATSVRSDRLRSSSSHTWVGLIAYTRLPTGATRNYRPQCTARLGRCTEPCSFSFALWSSMVLPIKKDQSNTLLSTRQLAVPFHRPSCPMVSLTTPVNV